MKTWLDVPYSEKDDAKRAGARWDPQAKRWWAPNPRTVEACQRWAAEPDLPTFIPGEDRSYGGNDLFIDMVPATSWFTNARSHLTEKDWQRVRRMVRTRAGEHCELCGTPPNPSQKLWLEGHERWTYHNQTQTLTRLLAVCSRCHLATHFGFARTQGLERVAFGHLQTVNRWTFEQTHQHILAAEELWLARSQQPWTVDVSLLHSIGITTHTGEKP